jgi:hypothetical protein
MEGSIVLLIIAIVVLAVIITRNAKESDIKRNIRIYGPLKENVICPHCQMKGGVHTKNVKTKKGISGGKATAALLTGGISMLATGLSRKESGVQAHCTNCDVTWNL